MCLLNFYMHVNIHQNVSIILHIPKYYFVNIERYKAHKYTTQYQIEQLYISTSKWSKRTCRLHDKLVQTA